ncbi:MAG: DUF401 family protein [Archaeoglobaceae archaeon]|nr:DUF401 family protein [Archaeoglobaceae archaeon]
MQGIPLLVSIIIALVLARKFGIGISLLIASLILGISTLGISFELFRCYLQIQSFEIMVIVFLTYSLANLMDKLGMLEKISNSLNESFGLLSVALIPLVIGLIPMPAGALFSATMLIPVMKKSKISLEKLTVINYWFRHVWTPVWPLYPSVIIALAVLGIEYEEYLVVTIPISLLSFIAGLTLLRGLGVTFRFGKMKEALLNIYPILVLLLIYLLTKNLLIAILISVVTVLVHRRAKTVDLIGVFRKSFELRIFALVFAVMGYKNIIQSSNSANHLYNELSFMPVEVAVFIVSFLVGFTTGIEMSYSSISLPIFHEFAEKPENLLLIISAGFFGVILSPFHLCYALTVEFFKANLNGCYKILIKLVFPVLTTLCLISII